MKESIIIFDTETTGLDVTEGADLNFQPHMIEIYCLKVNKKLKKIDEFYSLIKPPILIPEYLTKKVHGIDDVMVRKAPSFLEIYKALCKFFLGCSEIVAHNLSFDLKIIRFELQRIGMEFNFPYPPKHFCTVEQSFHLEGQRLKNKELYRHATGKGEIDGSHRAKSDVKATFTNYKWLKKNKRK